MVFDMESPIEFKVELDTLEKLLNFTTFAIHHAVPHEFTADGLKIKCQIDAQDWQAARGTCGE